MIIHLLLSLLILVAFVVSIYYIYIYISRKNIERSTSNYHHKRFDTSIKQDNINYNIEIDDNFIQIIINKYSTYKEFLTSMEFDNYFSYWNSHPEVLEEIKNKIENKHLTSLKYKRINY